MHFPVVLRTALVLLLCLPGPASRAEPVNDLYETDVPVASQDSEARDSAVRQGFGMVLVKAAGSVRVLQNPVVVKALAGAQTQLQQYYFRRGDAPATDAAEAAAPDGEPLLLHMSFSPRSVEDILRRAGEPILSPNRPGTLLWLALDEGSGLLIVNPDSAAAFSAQLREHAQRRGFPLIYPALDLEDSFVVTPERVAALDSAVLLPASQRYGADAVLIGRIVRSGDGQWVGEWQQQVGEEAIHGQGTAASSDALAGQLIDSLAETLAARFAVHPGLGNTDQVRIRIDGVNNFAAYSQLSGMLKRLAAVRNLRLALVDRDTLFFDLSSDATPDGLQRELSLFRVLRMEGEPGDLHYRWVGE